MGPRARMLLLSALAVVAGVALAGVGVAAVARPATPAPVSRFAVGNVMQAPDFRLPAVDGRTVSLSEYRDKKNVLLYFNMGVG